MTDSGKQRKLTSMLMLTLSFFFVELICGYASGSLALISDSFHMLSDVASFIIALLATRLAKTTNHRKELSYGLKRAEVLGALINGVSLLALCFTLVISAIQRFFSPEKIENPKIVLGVAIAGLLVNLVGMFLFHGI
jgi:solute carrier family 30 (zinc transporter), member 1